MRRSFFEGRRRRRRGERSFRIRETLLRILQVSFQVSFDNLRTSARQSLDDRVLIALLIFIHVHTRIFSVPVSHPDCRAQGRHFPLRDDANLYDCIPI